MYIKAARSTINAVSLIFAGGNWLGEFGRWIQRIHGYVNAK
jgi:hypothetical protein